MPSYVVKNAPADEKEGKMECQQRFALIGRGNNHKGGWGLGIQEGIVAVTTLPMP